MKGADLRKNPLRLGAAWKGGAAGRVLGEGGMGLAGMLMEASVGVKTGGDAPVIGIAKSSTAPP